jgi:hypothetical protein
LATLDSYVFHVEISVQQNAHLERDPKVLVINASTWQRGTLGVVPRREMPTKIRAAVSDLVDNLLNDYFSNNPTEN